MKIVVSATGPTLDDPVDPRFGRCAYLLLVDSENMDFEAIDNASAGASGGAGIATGQTVVDKGAKVVITGNIGPNAHRVLSGAGIEVITGAAGTVREMIEKYKGGTLQATDSPTVKAHAGMGASAPTGTPSSDLQQDLESIKGLVNTMKQQVNNLLYRIEEMEKKTR